MLTLPLLLVGYLVATRCIDETTFLERIAYSLVFAMIAAPWIAMNAACVGDIFVSKTLLAAATALVLAVLARHAWKHFRAFKAPQFAKTDAAVLLVGALVAVGAWLYYINAEFLLSMASYIQRGEAKCFYMQTFCLDKAMNPNLADPDILKMYGTIATPGNTMFTAPLMPLFGVRTYHILYTLFIADGFLFFFLLLRRWTENDAAALIGALFAVLNPYVLSVEVLDRNLMSYVLSAALIYTLERQPDKGWLHGILWGIAAGVGLRFLHLTLIVPIALIYIRDKAPWRRYAWLLAAFCVVFAFNLPHMRDHGFHSLGEQASFFDLLAGAFLHGARTPLLPFPNAVGYILHVLSFIGLAAAAISLLGAVALFKQNKIRFAILILILAPVYIVLAAQRDWIEADKFRIFLMAFAPVILFFGVGAASIFDKSKMRFNLIALPMALVLVFGSSLLLKTIRGKADDGLYERKPVYQHESVTYMDLCRGRAASVGIFPDYERLFAKLDFSRKRVDGQIIKSNFFGEGGPMAAHPFVEHWIGAATTPDEAVFSAEFVNVRIDFEKLAGNTADAAGLDPAAGEFFADLSSPDDLLDIYHKEIQVSWQPDKLPVTLLTGKPEYKIQKTLELEVNAFKNFGADEFGFAKVNMINSWVRQQQRMRAFQTGMTALPQTDDDATIALRVPRDTKILIRNWIINTANGTPYRVDSWLVTVEGGKAKTAFHIFEPESYL